MQTIWMGVLLEFFMARHLVTPKKILGAVLALAGTVLAAKVFETDFALDSTGVIYGLLAAVSYTATMYASNHVGLELTTIQILDQITWEVLWKWGCFLGFFGTILPPILFARGFPKIGTGVGSIVAALEIPVSVYSAYLVLDEQITILQWLGIAIILTAVMLINLRKSRKPKG
jgi:drug/metabolite transporter (DMT)-like permease